jgi:hypothetical protein
MKSNRGIVVLRHMSNEKAIGQLWLQFHRPQDIAGKETIGHSYSTMSCKKKFLLIKLGT